jgi:hypothetical protein
MNTTVGTEALRGPTGTGNVMKAKVFLEKEKVKKRYQQEQREEMEEQILEMKHNNLTVPPEMLGKTYGDAVKLYFKKTNHKDRVEEKAKIERMKWCLPLDTPLNDIHDSTIEPFIQEKISQGCKANTINDYKQFVGQILNTAMLKEDGGVFWRTRQHNLTREKTSDNVIPEMDVRIGYVLSWEEQDRLLAALPEHLRDASLYALNTGARMSEIANLRWEWEIYFKDLDVKAFRIPAKFHKNKKPKLVVLNSIAKEIIEKNRGKHPERVFSFKGKPVRRFNSTSFQRIRRLPKVDLAHVVFHDFRTTFSTRLGGYEVSKDTISILMGHTIKGITADYAFRTHSVELLLAAVDKLVERKAFTFVPAHENTFRTNSAQPFEYVETTKN